MFAVFSHIIIYMVFTYILKKLTKVCYCCHVTCSNCTGLGWDVDGDTLAVINDKSGIVFLWDSNSRRTTQLDSGFRSVMKQLDHLVHYLVSYLTSQSSHLCKSLCCAKYPWLIVSANQGSERSQTIKL